MGLQGESRPVIIHWMVASGHLSVLMTPKKSHSKLNNAFRTKLDVWRDNESLR